MEYKYYFIVEKGTNKLFAYSDNKTYIEEFKNSRNMSKFNIVKKYISREAVNELATDIPKKYLVCKELPTKPYGKKISLILTQYEYEGLIYTGNDIFFNKVRQNTHIDPSIFNEKYSDSLIAVGYGIYFHIWNGDLTLNDIFKYISPDYVNIFIHYFYNDK